MIGQAIFVLVIAAFTLATASAKTWYVPDDFSSIQGAIDAATSGDVIVIRPGTYRQHFKIEHKELTVVGSGAGVTVIENDSYDDGFVVDYIPSGGRVLLGHMTLRSWACLVVGGSTTNESAILSQIQMHRGSYPAVVPGVGFLVGGIKAACTRCYLVNEFDYDAYTNGRPSGAILLNGTLAISQGNFAGLKGSEGGSGYPPEIGGAGVYVKNSYLYLSDVVGTGGLGGQAYLDGPYCDWYWPAKPGGPGLEAVDTSVVIAAASDPFNYWGGMGGSGQITTGCGNPSFDGGDGGAGVLTDSTSRVVLVGQITPVGGPGGKGSPPGDPGPPTTGNVSVESEAWPSLTIDGNGAISKPLWLHVRATPGDRMVLLASDRFDKVIVPGIDGFALFAAPGGKFFFAVPLGTMRPIGQIDLTMMLPTIRARSARRDCSRRWRCRPRAAIRSSATSWRRSSATSSEATQTRCTLGMLRPRRDRRAGLAFARVQRFRHLVPQRAGFCCLPPFPCHRR